jgi:nucleotide-binding universal stress UspA family protein
MQGMKPIICVTDFDGHTMRAATVASAFAQSWNQSVVLVHSVDEREQFPFQLRSRLLQHDWLRLAREAQELRELGFDFEEKVLRGLPEDGIGRFAWRERSPLIVVGCTPTPVVDRWALGSLAEEIADTALVPTLAVRSAECLTEWLEDRRTLNVFVGIDPAARPDAMLNRLAELRGMGPCTITGSHVTDPELDHSPPEHAPPLCREYESTAEKDFIEDVPADLVEWRIPAGSQDGGEKTAESLVERARRSGADLLVITSHPRNELSLLPHRCLSHGVLRTAPMNVLCVPEPDVDVPRTSPLPATKDRSKTPPDPPAPASRLPRPSPAP